MTIAQLLILILSLARPWTQDIKEAKIKIDLHSREWSLSNKADNNGLIVYQYKRNAIKDNEGRNIVPNIAVIIEDIDEQMDVTQYSIMKRSQTPFDVDEVISPGSDRLEFQNAIGYRGHYTAQGLEHTIYIIHAINERKGIHIIMDVTTNILDKVDPEFLLSLKSIRK